ncbi:hypothetical protein EUTSA_v10022306mg, partial [Eutrema salsugineum]
MDDHQEFEKPIFELRHKKFRSTRFLIYSEKKNRLGESMNQYEEISCYYGLRENPKKTQKSPLDDRLGTRASNKKRLIRCEECGKGFRYEKCLTKHRKGMHSLNQKKSDYEESMIRSADLLCCFSDVQRRKRSKRVSRYKKIPRFSVSSSSSVSEYDGELLEVAESLILLSKSVEALVSNPGLNLREFEDGFLGNEQKLVGKSPAADGSLSTESDGNPKELLGFLGDNKADESCQVGAGRFRAEAGLERVSLVYRPGLILQNAKTDIQQKLDGQETNSGDEGTEHRCRLCDRVFLTYQALGGHQTFHRMRNKPE